MKVLSDIGRSYTLEEAAMDIIGMNGSMEHWAEFVVNAGGNVVNVEVVVTAVNGKKYGRQYVSDKHLPKWKLMVKRMFGI